MRANKLRLQTTVQHTCRVQGRGFWSGKPVTVVIHPAPADFGIEFCRLDLPSRPRFRATAEAVDQVPLRTNLVAEGHCVELIEHLMAALAGLCVDNAKIEVDAQELPGLDGSCLEFVQAIESVGIQTLSPPRPQIIIEDVFEVSLGQARVRAEPALDGESYFEYQLAYDDDTPIQPQAFAINLHGDQFASEVSSARTFVTADQAEAIQSQGLAQHVTTQDLVVIQANGQPKENQFRFPNECARHKLLDFIGDLSLVGAELIGRFTSCRGGHVANNRMARQLAALAPTTTIPYMKLSDSIGHPINRSAA